MTYLQFLGQWYNAVFLAAGLVGVVLVVWGRVQRRCIFRPSVAFITAAVTGLTWNGAIHDLGLGSPALRFPLVTVVAIAAGLLVARVLGGIRDQHFRTITGVRFNRPGQEGAEGRIVTRWAGAEPGSGRVQWQDEDGVLHVVHVHTSGGQIGFGCRVRLVAFDSKSRSYLTVPIAEGR